MFCNAAILAASREVLKEPEVPCFSKSCMPIGFEFPTNGVDSTCLFAAGEDDDDERLVSLLVEVAGELKNAANLFMVFVGSSIGSDSTTVVFSAIGAVARGEGEVVIAATRGIDGGLLEGLGGGDGFNLVGDFDTVGETGTWLAAVDVGNGGGGFNVAGDFGIGGTMGEAPGALGDETPKNEAKLLVLFTDSSLEVGVAGDSAGDDFGGGGRSNETGFGGVDKPACGFAGGSAGVACTITGLFGGRTMGCEEAFCCCLVAGDEDRNAAKRDTGLLPDNTGAAGGASEEGSGSEVKRTGLGGVFLSTPAYKFVLLLISTFVCVN